MLRVQAGRNAVFSAIIERFVEQFDFSSLTLRQRETALHEVAKLRPVLGFGDPRLAAVLKRFEDSLRVATPTTGRRSGTEARRLKRLLRWLVPLAIGTAGITLSATPALASHTAPAVGASIFNYGTNRTETVAQVVGSPGYAVVTNYNQVIILATTVGEFYTITNADATTQKFKVTAATTTPIPGGGGTTYVSSISVIKVKADGTAIAGEVAISQATYFDATQSGGAGGGTGSVILPPAFPDASGDSNRIIRIGSGASGGNGSDGGGIQVCIPLLGCATIGKSPSNGGGGNNGTAVTIIASEFANSIGSTSANAPGVVAISNGGNGGRGGDSYAININGANGGSGGIGGTVTITSPGTTTIVTTGDGSHGIYAQSSGGTGGRGGTGYGASSGGSGGNAGSGGTINIYNQADIHTSGIGAIGILAQSRGGGAGGGGDSYGIVGDSGNGRSGGGGGSVYVENGGTIWTEKQFAHGIVAQSIGGFGGSSGDSGGIVASVGAGGNAGAGGSASIHALSTSQVRTDGAHAHGLLAQSIGGNGGTVGNAGGIAAVGGDAGSGAIGGNVTVTADDGSAIETHGAGSYGILAESVGGNGGDVGWTGGVVAFGGKSGSGNNGGTVTVTSGASITTHQIDSRGVFAQSVGGGGGNAGGSYGVVALGGDGGAGGTGGTVTVALTAASDITTTGLGATAAFVQSVGGGGGAGAASGGVVGLGGKGDSGGTGGIVSLTNAGSITTGGDWARGLFAQSVGGGGGSGGGSAGLVAIGGAGNAAGGGGQVTIGSTGSIETGGDNASALFGQSVGGGGGDGGTSGGPFAVGGSGASGGTGGKVIASLSGNLATDGFMSHGLFAQSVGGGGGNGGGAYSGSLFAGLALGGSGSKGGNGGEVSAAFTNRNVVFGGVTTSVSPLVTTGDDFSRGVFIQSVGGGGGSGGMAVQISGGAWGAASFAIGGSGALGATGGKVSATGNVAIATLGDFSEGFFAQSVGGGGGNGGAAVSVAVSVGEGVSGALSVGIGGKAGGGGAGGLVDIASGGSISTAGKYSTGFVAQSVGGGGGTGGFSVSVAGAASDGIAVAGSLGIGGAGGSGGAGGEVKANFNGAITTGGGAAGLGSNSLGALIQSVGGGGGAGGFNVSATIALSGGAAVGAAVGLGGTGGSGGIGGSVTGSVGGDVITTGDRSTGVLIQSAGGGGGSGGFNISGNIGVSAGAAVGVAVGLGGTGGGGGTGGTVIGSALGKTKTYGDQSDGVVIQSIGGGGGSGGFNVSGNINLAGTAAVAAGVGLGGSGGGAGNGGIVTGTVADNVFTYGDQARGVIVQSVGGGGGAGAFNVTGGLAAGGTAGGTIGVGLGGTGGGGGGANTVDASAKSVTTIGDDSAGFIAQSVGGGGGAGGFNVTGSIGIGGTAGGTIGVGLGGSGGSGGSAMAVTAGLTGNAITGGDRSGAILAQSVGGGGGAGGFNVTGGIAGAGTGAASLNVGLGGQGGTAGHAGAVTLTVVGAASTTGDFSDGIVAQSVGGGGGSGGFNIAAGIAAGGTGAGQVGFGMGGRGGGGGNAGIVGLYVNNGVTNSDLTRVASVTTHDFSSGIVAQSLGGGGGNGGFNVTGGAAFAGTGAGGVNVGIGGSGGAGGFALGVTADISGITSTSGDDSLGIIAQSVGGGGGNGSFNVSGGLNVGGTGAGGVNVGIGGAGANGGTAGNALLRVNDQITTPGQMLVAATTGGDRSGAIIVQSLSGGGGNGGFNVSGGINIGGTASGSANVGIGGMGGNGGKAGTATADITGRIGTLGDFSTGLIVQSVGGGGGNGGFNVSGALSVAKSASVSVSVGIGGFGGDGGFADTATLDLNQRTLDSANTLLAVSTGGDDSGGIIVQSLGGGGGNGGFNVTGNLSFSNGTSGNVGVGVGGFGGGGGDGAAATARIAGDILTGGDRSGGLFVQSAGGGGGNGGFNVTAGITGSKDGGGNLGVGVGGFGGDGGDGKQVTATVSSDIQTVGDDSFGATFQSLGGGGGNGGFNVTGGVSLSMGASASGNLGIGIGGFGGDGGIGGGVNASLTGNIFTTGDNSYGALVQSVGGGGGAGGFNVTGNIALSKGSTGSIGIGVGGFGGGGGIGGTVIANLLGNVTTGGDNAYGALLQSLGGAGGAGGFNVTGNVSLTAGAGTSIAASVGLGGFGGSGGNGGTVTGTVVGKYQTSGIDSAGVTAQSVGGGGGAGGLNVSGAIALSTGTAGSGSIGIGGFGGGAGNGGEVKLTRTGDTFTTGARSFGVIAQSVGGGGGAGGINVSGGIAATKGSATALGFGLGGFGGGGGIGGDVTAKVFGNVVASGLESDTTVLVYDLSGLADGETTIPDDAPVIDSVRYRLGGSTGVLVQSVGGGGGEGGLNVTGQLGISSPSGAAGGRAASIGIGGFGGAGGNAGVVRATVSAASGAVARIQVHGVGDSQMAVAVQSIGGGGGAGGMNISGGISTSGQLVVGVGGFGGAGGTGGDVFATVDADLFAAGNNSIGFLVQSVGGGGGAGGINISGGIQAATKGKEPQVVFGIGGFGGTGNTAGAVTAVQNGQVMVEGQFAYGILAQSVGGGGGVGGLNVSAAVTGAGNAARKSEGIAISAGVGGNGGVGADAGIVKLTSNGNVFVNTLIGQDPEGALTFAGVLGAKFGPGVVAQSIGGGGGAGGANITGSFAPKGQPFAIGVGGTGGVGGNADAVTLVRGYTPTSPTTEARTPGTIMTFGDGSHGLVAQSIGGGGGNAGFNLVLAANKSKPKNPQLGAAITIGGDGGASGNGQAVIVRHLGDIYTHGSGSDGILAQSISGGGGSGALNVTGALTKDSSIVSLAIGGRGGDGGSSGNVTLSNDGTIVTLGDNSAGIRAQSIASGGGDVSAEEDLTTFFEEDFPIGVAIPIGPKNEIAVGIGDVGGKGGIAGDVIVNAAGLVLTSGIDSAAIHAQSIGGSGGASGTISVGVSGENQKGSQGGGIAVAVGLEGGESGIAGDVTVTSSATIGTTGERSRGIFGQSIGGSGGTGGEATNSFENASNETSISVGGAGGQGSLAGDVTITNSGLVGTSGDDADGVLAQSIGGGGGTGGASGTQNLQYESGDSNTVSVAVGGEGGAGAIAGDVKVTNSGQIITTGAKSFGIRAQSIGGGGGVGGSIDSKKLLLTGTSNSVEFNVGGGGGAGRAAGDVSVTNEGLIYTTGVDAAAISANSIGGGGGDAGSILDLSVSAATSNTFKANIGGRGGSGGTAGDVAVVNRPKVAAQTGWLVTEGDGAYGIFAQSLGGGGGNSSSILSISVDAGSGSMSAGFNFGNAGGTGNTAGNVMVDNQGKIDTKGAAAHGILAQSIGGGGGNGGIVISGNLNLANPVAAPLLSIGGSGGDGGDGGDVTVLNSGSIVTRGAYAHGIVAQSIGGGGGNAGVALALSTEPGSMIVSNTLAAALGATVMTGTGGEGGTVTVNHSGDITVLGEGSQAIVAESINGGGGSLTLDFDRIAAIFEDDADPATAPDPLVAARAGSIGSSGMIGGKVNVISSGTIGAVGRDALGLSIQSIGGGGGTMVIHGTLVAPTITTARIGTLGLSPATGARIKATLGSIGGSNNGGGDSVSTHSGVVVTTGDGSNGMLLQTIGGGGGRLLVNLAGGNGLLGGADIALGAKGETNSDGGDIDRIQSGIIATGGNFALGALLQSIGGGGGSALVRLSDTTTSVASLSAGQRAMVSERLALAPLALTTSSVTLGAAGGSNNDGGSVLATYSGGFETIGNHSTALLVESIGGGGGVTSLFGIDAPSVSLGGTLGATGTGGLINLLNTGSVLTQGIGSHGVMLQSIGGGGGAVFGDFTTANVTLNSANSGDGGAVILRQIGDIAVTGDRSLALVAQSLGGGGGFVDGVFAGTAGGAGRGGAIDLDVRGGIVAFGAGSTAVTAQSLGSLGGSNILIGASGDVRGGSAGGSGIALDGGANNVVTILSTLSAVSGRAITGTYGNDRLENKGLTVGNAFLGGGTNLVHNALGATFLTIDALDLRDGIGSNGLFDNDGTLQMGLSASRLPIDLLNGATFAPPVITNAKTDLLVGTSVISHVALDGNFRQSASGLMNYDVAFGPYASDRIDATGTAAVNGTANITLTWLENKNNVTLISTGAGGTDNGLNPLDTIAIDYGILANAAGIHLTLATDFGQDFLNYNQRQIGQNLDSSVTVGGASGIGRLLALIGNLTAGQEDIYADIFAELDPESLLAPAIAELDAARDFAGNVMECRADDQPGAKCLFARVDGHRLSRRGGEMDMDFGTSVRLRFGGAVSAGNGWQVGAALGVADNADITADNDRTKATGELGVHAGLGLRKTFADDRGDASVSVSAGTQSFKTQRFQNIFTPGMGEATIKTSYVGADASLGYTFSSGALFATPGIDLQAIRLKIGDFAETGLDGTGARSEGRSDWYLSATPMLTAGFKNAGLKLSGTVGYQLSDMGSIIAPIRLIGSPDASDPAMIRTLIDKQTLLLGVNVEATLGKAAALQFGFKGLYGDKVHSESANIKLVVRF